MSTSRSTQPEDSLEERLLAFMERNFPQIRMHGGTATVVSADPETGSVEIQLSGACSGCGIAPMTIRALEDRIIKEFGVVTDVSVFTEPVDDSSPAGIGENESRQDADGSDRDEESGGSGWLPF